MPFCRVIFWPSAGTTTLLSINLSFEHFWSLPFLYRVPCACPLQRDQAGAIFLLKFCNEPVDITLMSGAMKGLRN
ncbi:hypothetical protein CRX51_19255 [Pluralibacter gergoviae]|nr:hypothetical protein CRX51_19255 [Pluralibacter gergoviae]